MSGVGVGVDAELCEARTPAFAAHRGLIFPDCTFRKYKPTSFMSLLKPVVGRVPAAVNQIPLSERRRLRRPFQTARVRWDTYT